MTAAVSLRQLTVRFGGLKAVDDVSLDIDAGQRRVLLGPNGAGKTTLFHAISGQVTPTSGQVLMFGQDVTRMAPHQRARAGLARTFQITSLFAEMTVAENIRLSALSLLGGHLDMVRPITARRALAERVDNILSTWGFSAQRNAQVKELPYGDQRKLEIAMALAHEPRLLLLDEPTSGLSSAETEAVIALIKDLDSAVTLIVIEHDMDVAFEVADYFTILNNGRVLFSGTAEEVRSNQEIQSIYFGDEEQP